MSTTSAKRRSAARSGGGGGGAGEDRGDPLGGVPRKDRVARAEEADAFAGGGEKIGERQHQHDRRGRAC